jgi:hypothetical protein
MRFYCGLRAFNRGGVFLVPLAEAHLRGVPVVCWRAFKVGHAAGLLTGGGCRAVRVGRGSGEGGVFMTKYFVLYWYA